MQPPPPETAPPPGLPQESESASELLSALGADQLQRMQDTFADLGQVAIVICDPAGQPITKPSCATEFCRLLLDQPGGLAACRASVSRQVLAPDQHVAEVCHAGLVQYVAPVRVDGRHIATIILGDRPSADLDPAALQALSRKHGIAEDALRRAAEELGRTDERRRESVTRFLHLMADRLAVICQQHAQLTQRLRELEAVHDLTAMFAGTENLKDILTATAQRICHVMEVKACSLRLLDEETGELRVEAGYNLSPAYLSKGPVLVRENPLDETALSGRTVYIRDLADDPRIRYPHEARTEGLVSGLCVPMTYRGKAIGVIHVYTGQMQEFSDFQVALLRSIGAQIAAAILIYRLHRERLGADRHQQQLRNAAAIQRRMIPGERRTHAHITFGCIYNPALNVSGDFFDFIELPEGHLGFCMADVVGKGIAAALMMASVRAALRAHAHSIYNLDEIVGLVNAHLCRDTLISEFTTLFYGVFSADGRRLTYCNAGHEPGLLFRGPRVLELTTGGTVIGVFPEAAFSRGLIDLRAGDILVSYTDGLTDAFDFHDRPFGRERLIQSVRKYAELDAVTLAKQLLWDVRRFIGLADQADDITLVVAKVG